MKLKQGLSEADIEFFINHGYIKIENAFPKQLAKQARKILWADTNCDPDDKSTWTKPVIRLGDYSQKPFIEAANTDILHSAFDALVGKKNWVPRNSLGTFPVRFPSKDEPGDTAWHVEASFPGEDNSDFMKWRINVKSKGRGLLMLFLFSDIDKEDAPTKIRKGSHLIVSKILEPYGDGGLSFLQLAEKLNATENCEEVIATGEAGTVHLCHPFLVHAAQTHTGINPRFMAQPPLHLNNDLIINPDNKNSAPVELAILKGISVRNK